ncbi:FdhF/YdeP family oxidoreductase [Haliangium sp.]|uniref:FdhF/YdeP family oxidoreductase n=1 Tax=Haliangium sp. TaxID=2663208 RepID=UPI003D146094
MSDDHAEAKRARSRKKLQAAGKVPFGLGEIKPRHYLEMLRIGWRNRRHPGYAWKVLTQGVCDGCALGTTGLRDWTIDGTHLCLVRLNLLELNTMDGFDPALLADVSSLPAKRPAKLRDLGRLAHPMRRRAGEPGFTRVSWDEAMADLGARIGAADPDRIACYMTSRGITNEVYYAAQKAWRALGSPHIDNAARLCHSPSTAAMKQTLGVAASTCSYRDWYHADVVVFFGSNPANDQPVALKYLYEAKKRGARVLVVNTYQEPGLERYWIPSNVDSALFGTRIADGFFPVSAGGDLAFVYAVQKRLIERGGVDQAFIDEHTSGWDDYVAHLEQYSMDELMRRAGVREQDVDALAEELLQARTGVFVWSMGLTQHGHGSDTVASVCCLGLSKGFLGREGCGLMPIRGHSGVQGGAEMGAYATTFPGGRPLTDDSAAELAELWGFTPPAREGLDTVSMLRAAEAGGLDVLYSVGGNFVDTLPQPERIERAVENVPVRIHQDIVLTPPMLLEPKDVVYLLPARTRYESEGGATETTTERRVIYSPHIPGHDVGEAREEWRIVLDLARAAKPDMAEFLDFPDAAAIRADIARTIPVYADIVGLDKQGDAFQWGGPHLCEGGECPLPGGRARFVTAEPPDRSLGEGEFHVATRRGKQFNSIIHREHDHLTGADRDHVFMSPEDITRLGLRQDQAIVLRSAHGEMRGRVFSAPITPGNLQVHWPEANVLLDAERIDPGGRVPDYNVVARIEVGSSTTPKS